ncbi:peptidoglycan editing factor PgeF [Campylobacter corcagiensis]|uniref:peptidoglycan editing factor PgeF n=1 Tax=Campylobacter corcagiensis TaxID=1448857 RepID=UPI0004710268|nr:peptidoglycan editing factor PgeF [Campylobacter corcagiensis]QKF64251.1 multi-copper polyphenol oxidoreductase laccase [Campylobacter corcagiensis]
MIKFGFTNRFGGVSAGAYESLNLGEHVGDDLEKVRQNRDILRQNLGVKKLVFMEQIHSDKVEIFKDENLPPCDGIITNLKDVAICVMVADCMPILVAGKNSVAAVHAGRAGITKKILTKTLNLMAKEFSEFEFEIYVGPFIQGSCYEVNGLDLGEFNIYKNGKNFDMKKALEAEIKALKNYKFNKIEISNTCTHCNSEYFSYRRDGTTGRFCGYIYIS